jgi:uncharacterized membrane protein
MNVRINLRVVIIINLGLSLWLLGTFLAPVLASSELPLLSHFSSFLYFFYQPVCHQLPERSILIDGLPMAVCVRCLSVYLAGWLLSLFYIKYKNIRLWPLYRYIILVLPLILDITLELLMLYSNLSILRFVTGFIFGIVLFQLLFFSTGTAKFNPNAMRIKS